MGATVLMIGGPGMKKAGKGGKPYADEEAGGGDEGESEEKPSSRTEARMEASKAVIRAVKMSDASALDEALEAHYQACEGMGGGETE